MTREQILKEIGRTAEANGGMPLGVRRFSHDTGIKQSDWGRFWARWSDAIRESGLEPNKLTEAYSESVLLEKYAHLVQELGHTPASAELRLKAHNDPEFPNSTTFGTRFRSKANLAKRMVEYFDGKSGFADVTALCRKYVPSRPLAAADDPKLTGVQIGYVYLARSGRFYKIGKTNATGRREYELGIQLPEKITAVHTISTDDPGGIEAYWHKRFEAKRKKGEWFQLTPEDVSAFKRRKFM